MNEVLSLVRAARTSTDRKAKFASPPMLSALVALHEDMIEQLRLERLGTAGNTALLTELIDQHEKTAALLREKLESHTAANAANSPIPPMPPKPKNSPASPTEAAIRKPLKLHDVTNRAAGKVNVASHRHIIASQNAPGRPEIPPQDDAPRAQP